MTEVIKTENLTKIYKLGDTIVEAVKGVSLSIHEGEFVAVMGPSGSGKSTLMHLLGCLDMATSGKYFLEGNDISKLNDNELAEIRNKKIGFVFQDFNLLPHLNVWDNVMIPLLYNSKNSIKEKEDKVKELLEITGLSKRKTHLPAQLSGGERQRVAIVRALVNDPLIIFADEPTGNLDSKTGLEIMNLLKRLNEQRNVTEIIVTHDPNVASFTKRKITIKDGLIESDRLNGEDLV